MAINFPSSPSVGQIHTSGGASFMWDGVKWKSLGVDVLARSQNLADLADKIAARDNLGVAWELVAKQTLSVGVNSLVYPVSGYKLLKIQTRFWPSVVDGYLMGRFSVDGGATYKQAATDYNNTYSSTGASGAWNVVSNAQETYARFALAAGTASPSFATVIVDTGVEGGVMEYNGTYYGQHSTQGSQFGAFQGYLRLTNGPMTHLMLFPLSGQIAAKTMIIIEGQR